MTAELVQNLMGQLNEDAKKCGCKYAMVTRGRLQDVKKGLSEDDLKKPVIRGMRTTSTIVPDLSNDMKPVVKEVKDSKGSDEWKRENLKKTASVLREIQ